jgi:hypothetical protein
MQRCAFLSMDNLDEFECYDHLLVEPLEKRGWSVDEVSWRNNSINWDQFDVVVIRSPWDYQEDPEAFIATLEAIEEAEPLLENSLDLVKWNIDKTYLRDLKQQGVEIVPSHWHTKFGMQKLASSFDDLDTSEIIIKPTVSANADDTFRITRKEYESYHQKLTEIFDHRPFLIQPFMDNITEEGEFSVFFFDNTYSHTILKTPAAEDFRVQEEHGGTLRLINKPEKNLLQSARNLLDALAEPPLYSRMDYVRTSQNTFALMELELIEPSLYFNMDQESPERFARVFANRMSNKILASGK